MSKIHFLFLLVFLLISSCSESPETPHFSNFIDLTLEVEPLLNEELPEIILSINNTSSSFFSTDCEVWMTIQGVESETQENVFFDLQNGVFFSSPESTVIEVDANSTVTEQLDIESLKLEKDQSFADILEGEYSITCYLKVLTPDDPQNKIKSNTIILNK